MVTTMELLTAYEQWQLEKYGNILPDVPDMTPENGSPEIERFKEWVDIRTEQLYLDYEEIYE